MSFRIGLVGLDSSHAEDFIRAFNLEGRHADMRVTALHGAAAARIDELRVLDPSLASCSTLDVLLAGVDGLIVGHRDGGLHRDAAIAGLDAGRAVFVDKPLANARRDAELIVAAAERSGAPLLSGSALRWQPETRRIRARLAGIDGKLELHAWGTWYPQSEHGGAIFYAIHTIELAMELLGPHFRKVRQRTTDETVITYRCNDNEVALSFHPLGQSGHSDFGVDVTAHNVHFRQAIVLGDDYMVPVVNQVATMVRTGASTMTPEQLIAPLALMEEIGALLADA
jgi:predicted dehydrogenase